VSAALLLAMNEPLVIETLSGEVIRSVIVPAP